ncbi:hypothetical protein CHLNCDRAFT_136826 [Chlorella variabilis]|uniref:Uncharacterized protein n=1 Tax=Chlorella variabilis TaxID=554065 RepID=E1ZL51_CHLVA|nr:hypothetical protein CHLNCDRAFT_136826 [Chlorella variabilis]EFN53599.1 hypothetical protein CHLNCDRAFT_136826 [Chlorella variabilis]|eukprot:XP_005845701.1 hypothetical protein CHLNCDRAFT_136826 [Chlorella variabilis]
MPAEEAPQHSQQAADNAAGWGSSELAPPDPAAAPAARPGAPLSEALRKQLAQLAVDGSAWMDDHRLAVRLAAIAAVAGSVAFLLHTGHVAGWRQYASLAELPPRLLAPQAARLPVVMHSAAQHGEVLAVRVAHYPLLRRLVDGYRRVPSSAAAHRAADRSRLLTCYLAGPVQPTAAGLKYLKQLELVGVHRMRLLSVVDAADQAWTAPAAQDAAGSQARLQLGPGVAWGGWEQLAAQGAASAPADEAPTTPAPAAQQPPVAAQHDELAPVAAPSQRQQQERGAAGAAAAAAAAVHSGPMLWGELYAREPRRGLAALLPRQRGDVGERLISRGEAAMKEPIDLEWLGCSWHRIDRLYAAEQAAIRAGLGIWAVRRPGLGEWSRSVARSAWMRVRHTARTTAAAAAGSVSGAAAAAGTAVAGALTAKPSAGSAAGRAAAQAEGVWSRAAAAVGRRRMFACGTRLDTGGPRCAMCPQVCIMDCMPGYKCGKDANGCFNCLPDASSNGSIRPNSTSTNSTNSTNSTSSGGAVVIGSDAKCTLGSDFKPVCTAVPKCTPGCGTGYVCQAAGSKWKCVKKPPAVRRTARKQAVRHLLAA